MTDSICSMKNISTYYSSRDWLPWSVIALTVAVCLLSVMAVNVPLAIIMTALFVMIEVGAFLSTYYVISGDELKVHSSFRVTTYPIAAIREIKPTNSWLAAPAASLSNRIAVTFTRESGLNRSIPLIISPSRQAEFIRRLQSINPEIDIKVPEKSVS